MTEHATGTPVERVTLDDIRHKAEAVKHQAVEEAKGAAEAVVHSRDGQTLAIVAGIVVVAVSLAFFLGSRSARSAVARQMLQE